MKDSSLDTVVESGADFVPLRKLVEGLHYSEIQTSELQETLFSWCLISGLVGSISDQVVGFGQQDRWCAPSQCFGYENFVLFKLSLIHI